jgi:8-oxo-dGTP pyrophosphatase MutT (NUDIX family)
MELWDVYDADKRRVGRTHERGAPMAAGDYHLGVHAWLARPDGRFLVTRRDPGKPCPLLWECTGGSALSGEDGLAAALREVREETGYAVDPARGRKVAEFVDEDTHVEAWVFVGEFTAEGARMQPGETVEARIVTLDEMDALLSSGQMVPSLGYFPGLARLMLESPKGAPWSKA